MLICLNFVKSTSAKRQGISTGGRIVGFWHNGEFLNFFDSGLTQTTLWSKYCNEVWVKKDGFKFK